MKSGMRIILLILFIILYCTSYSQVTIGSDKHPEEFSVLELDSGEGGLRLNQLNAEQKLTLTNLLKTLSKEEAKGLTIYDLTTKTIQYWDGTQWIDVVGTINFGSEGQFLKSNGTGRLPQWVTLKIPEIKKGDYYLYSSVVIKDDQGVILYDKAEDVTEYYPDDPLTSEWVVLDGLTTTINIPDIPNVPAGKPATRLAIHLQAGGQIGTGVRTITANYVAIYNNPSSYYKIVQTRVPAVSFAIGIFINDKLKLTRLTRIEANGGGMSFSLYTVMGMVENLTSGAQTIKVAVRRRASTEMDGLASDKKRFSFGIGIPEATNVNPFMTQSSMKLELFALDTETE